MALKYKPGDKVFAKVRGYPFWPAKVNGCADETPNKVKYHVFFYGTAETAICKSEDVVPYVENKEKYGKAKKGKRFVEGLQQIEIELNGGVIEPIKILQEPPEDQDHQNLTIDENASSTPTIPVVPKKKKVLGMKRKRESTDTEDAIARKQARLSTGQSTSPGQHDGDSPTSASKAVSQSRSGRKIKPKKFADEDEERGVIGFDGSSNSDATHLDTSVNKIRKSQGAVRNSDVSSLLSQNEGAKPAGDAEVGLPSNSSENRVVLAKTTSGDYVQIKLDADRPKVFESESAREMWDMATLRNATRLKAQIELGEIPDAIKKQLDGKLDISETLRKDLKRENELQRKRGKLKWLKQEAYLLDLDAQIKNCLSLNRADTTRCLQVMEDMLLVDIDPLMLKKHPAIVETVKKLQRYIGNVPKWNLSEAELSKFKENSDKIRAKATHMYHKFKKLFAVPTHKSFWDVFSQEVERFKELVKELPAERVFGLIVDPEKVKDFESSDDEEATPKPKKRSKKSPSVVEESSDSIPVQASEPVADT